MILPVFSVTQAVVINNLKKLRPEWERPIAIKAARIIHFKITFEQPVQTHEFHELPSYVCLKYTY